LFLIVGNRAPDFRVATVGGTSRALHDYAGRPTVLCGWGSWHPSREALPLLERFHRDHPSIRTVSIAFDAQGPAFAMRYLRPAGATHELLIDATCVLSRAWRVRQLPFTVGLDANLTVRYLNRALDSASLQEARLALEKEPLEGRAEEPTAEAGDTRLDVLVQGCGIYLSRGRTKEAADSLRKALDLDPGNEIIRGQIVALEEPARVYGA